MFEFWIVILALFYLVGGQLVLLQSDLQMRAVCRPIWANPFLYCVASLVWPPIVVWMEIKWQLKKRRAR